MTTNQASVRRLADELERARRIVAFTGAGISTESGIPDFRSPGGIWERYRPIDFGEFMASAEARREAWRRKAATRSTLSSAAPNTGHHALARLHAGGRLAAVITQNVDGLHQASGLPDDAVIELHGNATYATCLACGLRHDLDEAIAAFLRTDRPPDCGACGGIVKSATISFGQPMPADAMERAEEASGACDLMLVLGTSLVVYPAAGFPRFAKARGARLAILNRDETDQDELADLVLHEEIGDLLAAAVEMLDGR